MSASLTGRLLLLFMLLVPVASSCSPHDAPAPEPLSGWTALPHEDWPRIAMVNRIHYTDSDHPMAEGEVGREGVAICTLKDMETLFEGIDFIEKL